MNSSAGFYARGLVPVLILIAASATPALASAPEVEPAVRAGVPPTLVLSSSGSPVILGDGNTGDATTAARAPVTQAAGVRSDLHVADNSVFAEVISGNTLYLGGAFTMIGAATGGWVPIDATSGLPVAGFPKVDGTVDAAIADGAGGWYIGGFFTSVGGVPRSNLAHILSDNSVSPWDPGADAAVGALATNGAVVYVGGGFSNIGGQPRSAIAAIERETGLATAWNPNATWEVGIPTVTALAVDGSTVYAGGYFDRIGGLLRDNIAALDASTGDATAWAPYADESVRAMALSPPVVYVGGHFTQIGGQPRRGVAALDLVTGEATAWDPNPTGYGLSFSPVYAIVVDGSTVYVGGLFQNIGSAVRNCIAALDATTGLATGWNPNANNTVGSLAVSGSTVYAGGFFTQIGGQSRTRIAALDKSSGLPTGWNPGANSYVDNLAVSGSTVFAGGWFTSVGGVTRNRLAALDLTTGAVTAWDPNADGSVGALFLDGTTVYAGGAFNNVGPNFSSFRRRVAAFDATTGLPTAWAPNPTATVRALAVSGSRVYGGGDNFGTGCLTAWDGTTGATIPLGASANSTVYALTLDGTTLYVGGAFTNWGGVSRQRLAALDATTGLLGTWDPAADSTVRAIAAGGATVYAGGNFAFAGGQPRNRLAALDATTGLATAWDPNANGSVRALTVNGPFVYAGGLFTNISGQPTQYLAALDATTGGLQPWNPAPDNFVLALTTSGSTVYAGGGFWRIGGLPQSCIAGIEDATVDVPPSSRVPGIALLERTAPNPFGATTSIRFTLATQAHVTLKVYDTLGREVATLLAHKRLEAGPHRVEYRPQGLASGIYLIRLDAGGTEAVGRVVHLR